MKINMCCIFEVFIYHSKNLNPDFCDFLWKIDFISTADAYPMASQHCNQRFWEPFQFSWLFRERHSVPRQNIDWTTASKDKSSTQLEQSIKFLEDTNTGFFETFNSASPKLYVRRVRDFHQRTYVRKYISSLKYTW